MSSVSLVKRYASAPVRPELSRPFANTHRVTYRHPFIPGQTMLLAVRVTEQDARALAPSDPAEIKGCARIMDVHHIDAERAYQVFQSVAPIV